MPILGVIHGTKIGPNAPTVTSVTDVGTNREFDNGAVDVAFSLPNPNTAISYKVTSSNGQVATGASSPIRVQNLPTGINTTFTVLGVNDITIEGPPSTTSTGVVVTTVPFRPTMGVATAGNGEAFVVFSLLNSGGKQVISYVATGSPAGTANNTGSPITVSSLNNNVPHAFTVVAVNANGTSFASSPSNIVTPSTSGGGVPAGTFYCYSSDCFSQDGVTFAYLQAPIFTSVSPSDQSTITPYSGGFGFARGTRVTYCNTVEATAATGAQQSSCQANYVAPVPPPPCDPTEYTSECGTYTTGPQVPGCSPTSADYGYTVTQTASKTRTIYDCNGIIISTTLIPCIIETFTATIANDPRCPGYRAQQGTAQVSGQNTNTNVVVVGDSFNATDAAASASAAAAAATAAANAETAAQNAAAADTAAANAAGAAAAAAAAANAAAAAAAANAAANANDANAAAAAAAAAANAETAAQNAAAADAAAAAADAAATAALNDANAAAAASAAAASASATASSQSQGTPATVTATAGTFVRDPGGAGFQDPNNGVQTDTWYNRVEPDGSTTLFLLPETNGVPDTSNINEASGIPIPADGFNFNIDLSGWDGFLGGGLDGFNMDVYTPFTPAELAAIEASLVQPSTPAETTPVADTTEPSYDPVASYGNGGGCFTYGTSILMADDSTKLIQDMKKGDVLKSMKLTDFPHGDDPSAWYPKSRWSSEDDDFEIVSSVVTHVKHSESLSYFSINDKYKVTYEHYILIKRANLWQMERVDNLLVGDFFIAPNSTPIEITSIKHVNEKTWVVDIDVEDNDFYFADGILVHNFKAYNFY